MTVGTAYILHAISSKAAQRLFTYSGDVAMFLDVLQSTLGVSLLPGGQLAMPNFGYNWPSAPRHTDKSVCCISVPRIVAAAELLCLTFARRLNYLRLVDL